MAAKIISDNKFDHEIAATKALFDVLSRDAQTFMAGHKTLPAKERAAKLMHIQQSINTVHRFVNNPRPQEMPTAGTKFAFENLKTSFGSFVGRWQKFERSLG